MMIMIPNVPDEADWTPTAEAVAAMAKFNADLRKAGILLSADGLHPAGLMRNGRERDLLLARAALCGPPDPR